MMTRLFEQLPLNSRVLFIRIRNLGESVLDTANLRALKRFRPDLEVTTLVEAIFTDLYLADPDIKAIPLQRSAQQKRSSLLSRLETIRDIRSHKYDVVINLHGGPTSANLTFLSGAKYRIGASHYRNQYAYNMMIPPAETILDRFNLHSVEVQFGQFKWLGMGGDEPGSTKIFVDPSKKESAYTKLRMSGVDFSRPYVVIAPTNEFFTKRWPAERYAELSDKLYDRGFQIVITGAPTEEQRSQLAEAATHANVPVHSFSNLDIGELVAVIEGGEIFIGNDSGPAHIAAAVDTPPIVLFGPANAVRWRPWIIPESSASLVQNYFPCNPCPMYTCEVYGKPECILSITVDQTMQAIDNVLTQRHKRTETRSV